MVFTGNALTTNLLKHGYNVTTVLDTNIKLCELFPQCEIAKSPKEVAVSNDIILTGYRKKFTLLLYLKRFFFYLNYYRDVMIFSSNRFLI